jgi:catechol 2,3-dioxygenase-like lactoylglutathione lyase family enzyme
VVLLLVAVVSLGPGRLMARRARLSYALGMPTFHHVNLGVPPDDVDSEIQFLVDVLGYRQMALDDNLRGLGARWYEADDGSQVHLSLDPDHRPAARAHVAVGYGPDLNEVERRLEKATVEFESFQREGLPRVVICCDPAGNRWELRGDSLPG